MKIGSLAKDVVKAVYEHGEDKLNLEIDRNIITPAFLRRIAEIQAEQKNGNGHKPENEFAETADRLEVNAKASARLLSDHLLKSWDLTEDDGVTLVPITEDTFANRLPPLLVTSLFTFALEQAQTVKKTISETSGDGTQEPEESNGQSM